MYHEITLRKSNFLLCESFCWSHHFFFFFITNTQTHFGEVQLVIGFNWCCKPSSSISFKSCNNLGLFLISCLFSYIFLFLQRFNLRSSQFVTLICGMVFVITCFSFISSLLMNLLNFKSFSVLGQRFYTKNWWIWKWMGIFLY